jgi:hypothetical protein
MDGMNESVPINVLEYRVNLIYVNRTIRHRLAQLLPFAQIPFECFWMDVVTFGSDVVVDGVCQRDGISPLEGDVQLVCHIQFGVVVIKEDRFDVKVTNVDLHHRRGVRFNRSRHTVVRDWSDVAYYDILPKPTHPIWVAPTRVIYRFLRLSIQ